MCIELGINMRRRAVSWVRSDRRDSGGKGNLSTNCDTDESLWATLAKHDGGNCTLNVVDDCRFLKTDQDIFLMVVVSGDIIHICL